MKCAMTNYVDDLVAAYHAVGQIVDVQEISPGRYQVTKTRFRQIISHRDLMNEIERLRRAP